MPEEMLNNPDVMLKPENIAEVSYFMRNVTWDLIHPCDRHICISSTKSDPLGPGNLIVSTYDACSRLYG